MVAPTTSYPRSTNMAAATEESTPPDIATRTRSFPISRSDHSSRFCHELGEYICSAGDLFVGVGCANAHADGASAECRVHAECAQYVTRTHTSTLARASARTGDTAEIQRHQHR